MQTETETCVVCGGPVEHGCNSAACSEKCERAAEAAESQPVTCPECGMHRGHGCKPGCSLREKRYASEALDLLTEIADKLDKDVDTDDGPDGQPVPNWAMHITASIDELLRRAGR